jgi:hypothetical protein
MIASFIPQPNKNNMKKLIFAVALLMGGLSVQIASAQIGFRLNVNIGSQPAWGPVGYSHADYYYMPDVDAYYDVPSHMYIYNENNVWVHRAYLPERYRNYDVYHGYKVVVNQPNPWLKHTYYQRTYAPYRGRGGQQVIRDSREARYRQHWNGPGERGREVQYERPHDNRNGDKHDNGNRGGDKHDEGRGNGKGNGHGRGHGDR